LLTKYCLGTIPAVQATRRDSKKVVYCRFMRHMCAQYHAAILDCYTKFNNTGGVVLKLQIGRPRTLFSPSGHFSHLRRFSCRSNLYLCVINGHDACTMFLDNITNLYVCTVKLKQKNVILKCQFLMLQMVQDAKQCTWTGSSCPICLTAEKTWVLNQREHLHIGNTMSFYTSMIEAEMLI
jgi:hypothetical protein